MRDTIGGRLMEAGVESVGYMGHTTGGRLGTRLEGHSGRRLRDSVAESVGYRGGWHEEEEKRMRSKF